MMVIKTSLCGSKNDSLPLEYVSDEDDWWERQKGQEEVRNGERGRF